MSEKDAFSYLIQKNAGVFQKIDYSSLENSENTSEEQNDFLTKVRHILFGTMKLIEKLGQALRYLHEDLNIAHNDIKPDNFFAHCAYHPLIPCSKSYDFSNKTLSFDDDGV